MVTSEANDHLDVRTPRQTAKPGHLRRPMLPTAAGERPAPVAIARVTARLSTGLRVLSGSPVAGAGRVRGTRAPGRLLMAGRRAGRPPGAAGEPGSGLPRDGAASGGRRS